MSRYVTLVSVYVRIRIWNSITHTLFLRLFLLHIYRTSILSRFLAVFRVHFRGLDARAVFREPGVFSFQHPRVAGFGVVRS